MRDCSVSMARANLLALVMTAPLACGLWFAFSVRWGWALPVQGLLAFLDWPIALPAVGLGVVAHEAIHAATWALASRRPISAIAVGVLWRSLTPYAHPRDPMEARAYRIGGMMPGLVLGILPAVAAVALGWPQLLIFGLIFTLAAGGDALVLWLIRDVSDSSLVQDHPSRAGCVSME